MMTKPAVISVTAIRLCWKVIVPTPLADSATVYGIPPIAETQNYVRDILGKIPPIEPPVAP